ncbi:siroheme synthase CysG [Bradyrhizobium sp. WD16]|uniref:siroheme synthase CysG n=1 Tax=Bradyrhizobium sp. WD16 TaxID=1521768 RepID=UPI0020A3AA61|nr:siroheme synthase CysG [Bradyrhizobium sp. WD16]UTD27488.1 uroporphyrinogen-III C-methyltransferase [Bradyrhizobium sp. WD16]
MRFLPVFLDLHAGPVLLVGQGEPARAKLRLLLAAGAEVRWHAPDGNYETGVADAGRLTVLHQDPLAIELGGIIAVVCAGAGELGHAMAARARRHGLPVNVMDEPEHSSFIVPAIVDRGDVVVAIGTGGAAPVLARRLREKIETLLPARIGDLAAFIGRWRKPLSREVADHARRRFWEQVVDGPVGAAVLEGRQIEAERALAELAAAPGDTSVRGFVTLVGAGPGDPDLLTVKALRVLQDADIIFYDELVSSAVLDRGRRDATRVLVGRRVGRPGIGQDAIHRLLIEAARCGQRVVRLKGGDSFVFGRGGEEVAALRDADIPYAVVPGITAALGAASAFEVPLTYRRQALRITFLTAHQERDAEAVDWGALTDEKMTVVVYMGMTAAPAVRAGLLAAGRSPMTPVGVFARVTRPDQQAAVGVLDNLPELVAEIAEGPAILVIGEVVTHSAPWRANNPFELLSSLGIAAE